MLMRPFISILILCTITALLIDSSRAEDQWSFITLADWHGAEAFALDPGDASSSWTVHLSTIQYVKETHGSEMIILPGDSNSGKWDIQEFIDRLDPTMTPQEAVLAAGRNCYNTMKDLFSEGGFDTILMAVGDHELGGNAWEVGSSKVLSLPEYRQAFTQGFNQDSDGNFLFDASIGSVASRPLGTIYENTSYAYRHKNALFVTVDAFEQVSTDTPFLDRENGLGGEGIVTCTVNGVHLTWFENILKEASDDETIKHIFV